MSRSAVLKFAPAMLVAVLALSHGADQAQAWWHHWGCHYQSYGYAPLFPIFRRPLLHHWGHHSGYHWLHAYRYPSWYHNPSYCATPYYAGYHSAYAGDYYGGYSGSHYGGYYTDDWGGAVVDEYYNPLDPYAPEWSPPPGVLLPHGALPRTAPPDEPPLLPPEEDQPPVRPRVETPLPDRILPADPAPALPLLPGGPGAARQTSDSTILAVQVPSDARVFVNGMLTKTPGSYRQYVSRGLVPGHGYRYEIRAELDRGGRLLTETQTVTVGAGEMTQVAFRLDSQPVPTVAQASETVLTVRVPEAARVTLEGQRTQSTGDERRFSTRELARGQVWPGYRVVVEMEHDGVVQTHERTIELVGGQHHELSFDIVEQRMASR